MSGTLIIDYGLGNLQSVKRAFEECGADAFISDNPDDLKHATHIVLPGVGAFNDGMANLTRNGWTEAIRSEVLDAGIPLLGICLGMQLLARKGLEGGETNGLDLIPGIVEKLTPDTAGTRIPHVGWNEIYPSETHPLLNGIAYGTDFYFVHSYHFVLDNMQDAIAVTPYCGRFVSAIARGNVHGVQFHPEKSQKYGFQIIRNFLAYNGL